MLIGEVAERSGVSARMLRHYDSLGLVSPSERTSGGYRSYSEADLDRLFHVEGLRSLGLSLADIAAALDSPVLDAPVRDTPALDEPASHVPASHVPASHVPASHVPAFDPTDMVDRLMVDTRERIARDQELLDRLARVRAGEPSTWADVLRTIALVRGLAATDPSARQRVALAAGDRRGDLGTLAEAVLAEPQINVADTLIWALARIGDDAVPVLAEALGSPDSDRRHRAAHALRKFNTPAALTALARERRHADPVVAARAVLAGGTLGDVDAIPALVALVRDGHDDVEAADVLAVLATDHSASADRARSASADRARSASADHGGSAAPEFDRADSASADHGGSASADHGGSAAPEFDRADAIVRAVAEALDDADAAARRRLTSALADIPGPRAALTLRRLTADPDPGVAATARFLTGAREGKC